MKKIIIAFCAAIMYASAVFAQCSPGSPATVFATHTANGINTNTYTSVPTGNVIQVNVTLPSVRLNVDLCATNVGPGPHPAGNNDSYVTILTDNGATSNYVGTLDDGCDNVDAPGYGPSVGIVTLSQGTYFIYITEYDANSEPCGGNDGTTLYTVALSSVELIPPTNDNCTQATSLSLGTPFSGSNIGATVNTAVEGLGGNNGGSIGITSPCNTPNGYPVFNTVWFSFNAPSVGYYDVVFEPTNASSWGVDLVFLPQADVSCTNINSTSFANAFCKTLNQSGSSTITVYIPASGNYLIPVSTYEPDQQFDFTITINTSTATPSCATANAGDITITPCTESTGEVILTYTPPTFIETVGYTSSFFEIIASAEITDFSQLNNNPSVISVNATSNLVTGDVAVPASDVIDAFGAGVFYYYIVAANDAVYENDELTFNANCIDVAGAMFEVKAAGESCVVGIDKVNQNGFSLFPNPATTRLNFTLNHDESIAYEIIAADGKARLNGTIDSNNNHIDIAPLAQGVYFFSGKNNNNVPVMKRFTVVK